MRVYPIVTGEVYHVYSKSIAGYTIFNNDPEYARMHKLFHYYQAIRPFVRFSRYEARNMQYLDTEKPDIKNIVQIICYCIMPTHIHLILKQLKDKGISDFMRHILDSYTRYFNIKHNRKGPLLEGRFKRVLVESDEQLLHLTRYIHLNPATAYLVNNPIDWRWSSYWEYVAEEKDGICKFDYVLDIKPDTYKTFV